LKASLNASDRKSSEAKQRKAPKRASVVAAPRKSSRR